MQSSRLHTSMRMPSFWIPFAGLVFAGWAALVAMAVEFSQTAPLQLLGPGMEALAGFLPGGSSWPVFIDALCFGAPGAGQSSIGALIAMWGLMALAMMAPTAAPMIRTYGELGADGKAGPGALGLWSLAAGFIAVWIGFAVAAAAVQALFAEAGLMTVGGLVAPAELAAGLLAVAGLYQFSALKAACLVKCRRPMSFFLAHWRPGAAGAFRMGLHQGAACLGCCWALMALAFVGGTMNLVWMAVAMVLMAVEKLPQIGRYVSAPLGVLLLMLALTTAWQAATA